MAKRLVKGFTLIELLIVVAIIGIIAAIAIPNLITAIQRGKQKRTVADIRNIGTAVEAYNVDEARTPSTSGTVNTALNVAEFVPFYIKVCPTEDGWKDNIMYDTDNTEYSLISYGRYGVSAAPAAAGEYDNKSFAYDIYFSGGQFTSNPAQK